jgi:hypothetical protein
MPKPTSELEAELRAALPPGTSLPHGTVDAVEQLCGQITGIVYVIADSAKGVTRTVLDLESGDRVSMKATPPGAKPIEAADQFTSTNLSGWTIAIAGPLNRKN